MRPEMRRLASWVLATGLGVTLLACGYESDEPNPAVNMDPTHQITALDEADAYLYLVNSLLTDGILESTAELSALLDRVHGAMTRRDFGELSNATADLDRYVADHTTLPDPPPGAASCGM